MFTTIVTSLFLLAGSVQLYFWVISFSKIRDNQVLLPSNDSDRVSIIICARNELNKLRQNLPLILDQAYPNFEVILVDHGSEDGTSLFLEEFALGHSNLISAFLPFEKPGKREALRHGLSLATGSIILLTDADCTPTSRQWIHLMSHSLQNGFDISIGVAPFHHRPGLLNAFARWENFVTLQLFASQAMEQNPFMALGRNLAYRSTIIQQIDPESSPLIGGDDDLFINAVARRHNTTVVLNANAHMMSDAVESIWAFLFQKRRHVSTSAKYRLSDQVLLFLFAASTWCHHLLLFLLVFVGQFILAVLIYALRASYLIYRIQNTPNVNSAYRFRWNLIAVDLAYLIYYPLIALFMLQKPPVKWK